MSMLKRLARSSAVQKLVGLMAAEGLRLVWLTNRFVVEPADAYERVLRPDRPMIAAMWHGQHFMMPFTKRRAHRVKVLISRHRDGEINAIAAKHLGILPIRGSGSNGGHNASKGGASGLRKMLEALHDGYYVALTADVPKISRVAGPGIVKLAELSGRSIVPVAIATSRRIQLNNWDRSVINLPFGRGAIVVGDPIDVPAGADDATLEAARRAVEAGLNATTERAYALVDRVRLRSNVGPAAAELHS